MKRFFLNLLATVGVVSAFATGNRQIIITPYPQEVHVRQGEFMITPQTSFVVQAADLKDIAGYFGAQIKRSTGYELPVNTIATENSIILSIDNQLPLNEEGYVLEVMPGQITVTGKSDRGVFYGMQTVMQLLPPEIEEAVAVDNVAWTLPCVSVKDEPRFAYRGMMLDVCRHFLDVDFVKKQLDIMAMFKMNYFHWHLTDDHLWTIEIKKYPLLTEIGSIRHNVDGSVNRGFYTQDQIREVVAYAAEKKITVIPEIELPGHALAAITAYPELSCIEGPFRLRNQWGWKITYIVLETTVYSIFWKM